MTRLPELYASLTDAAVPDAAEESELESLVRTIPKLMGILPDALYLQSDPRHKVALAEMMAGLTMVMDQVKPLVLVRCPFVAWLRAGFFSDGHLAACVGTGTLTSPTDGDGRGNQVAAYSDDGARAVHAVYSSVVTHVAQICDYQYLNLISRGGATIY